ncbi:MAG: hypothetical protein ACK5O2_01860 [Microthrixaceae bacterium]
MITEPTAPDALLALRVWLPDRPGALGAVASRIGAVGGDLVGIEIVDRGAGRVVDELSVVLSDPGLLDLLVDEIHAVEGTDVEDARWVGDQGRDPLISALRIATRFARAGDGAELTSELLEGALTLLRGDWVMLVDTATDEVLGACASAGSDVPTGSWAFSFLRGMAHSGAVPDAPESPDDMAFSPLGSSPLVLLLSRQRVPLRSRERSVLHELCSLAALQGNPPAPCSGSHPG